MTVDELLKNSFCITLSDVRYDSLCKNFRAKGLSRVPVKYSGTNLLNVQTDWYKNMVNRCDNKYLRLAGCYASHASLVKLAKITRLPFICIFEDDAVPRDDIGVSLKTCVNNIPSDADCVVLGLSSCFNEIDLEKPFIHSDSSFIGKTSGAHAYILFEKAYDRYLDLFNTKNCVADQIFFMFDHCYIVPNPLFLQYNSDRNTITMVHIGFNVNTPYWNDEILKNFSYET